MADRSPKLYEKQGTKLSQLADQKLANMDELLLHQKNARFYLDHIASSKP